MKRRGVHRTQRPPNNRAIPAPVGWVNTLMRCTVCAHPWVATHHTQTPELECPGCGHMNKAASGERQ